MRDAYAKETDPAKQKQIAIDLQKVLGRSSDPRQSRPVVSPGRMRTNIDGTMVAPVPVFWNISKK